MKGNWKKLSKLDRDVRQNIDRRGKLDLTSKEASQLNKRLNEIKKVITDPDAWNVNIGSRERMDQLEKKLDHLIGRIDGISYIMKSIVSKRNLTNEDIQTHLGGDNNDNSVSGSRS